MPECGRHAPPSSVSRVWTEDTILWFKNMRSIRHGPHAESLRVSSPRQHKNLWCFRVSAHFDLDTGADRELTNLARDFDVEDFDVSPDAREIVVERIQERSDVVLIDLAAHRMNTRYPSLRVPHEPRPAGCRGQPGRSRARKLSKVNDFCPFGQAQLYAEANVNQDLHDDDLAREFRRRQSGVLEGLSMSSLRASLGTRVTAAVCAAILIPSSVVTSALAPQQAAATTTSSAARIPNDQLDSLVAPMPSIRIRSWRRRWPPRPTRSKSSNCNSGWPDTPT